MKYHWSMGDMTLADLVGTGETVVGQNKTIKVVAKAKRIDYDTRLERKIIRRQQRREEKLAIQQVLKGAYGSSY